MTAAVRRRKRVAMPHGLDPDGVDLTAGEVADRLKIGVRTITRYLAAGEFPGSYRLKGSWRVPQAGVIEFIRRNQRP